MKALENHHTTSPKENMFSSVYRELALRFHPERGWYRNNRPKTGEWKRRRRAWDWIKALTLKQMVSEETHPRLHSGLMSEEPRNHSP